MLNVAPDDVFAYADVPEYEADVGSSDYLNDYKDNRAAYGDYRQYGQYK